MEDRFNEFMDNHWPHMVAKVAALETKVTIGGAIGLALLVAILGVLVKGL